MSQSSSRASSRSSDLDLLLEQSSWVRKLARRLVRTDDEAEDLVQDTYAAALEKPPTLFASPRAWLGGVLRNLARQRRRVAARRTERERAHARGEALPSTFELLDELSLQHEVAEAVRALDEPYRRLILLRFYKDLSVSAIARQEGVPISTVHGRLRRGLALLRGRLDVEHGGGRAGREAWVLALFPLAERPAGLLPGLLGALAVTTTTTKLAALAAAALLLAAGLWTVSSRSGPERESRAEAPAALRAAELEPASETLLAVTPLATGRDAVHAARPAASAPVGAAAPPSKPAAAPPPATFAGRVIDDGGRPVPYVRVAHHVVPALELKEPTAHAETDGRGRFELELHEGLGTLLVETETYTTLIPGRTPGRTETEVEAVVVVTVRRPLAGRVVDPDGVPLAGVKLEVQPAEELFRELRLVHAWRPRLPGRAGVSDAEGRFEIARAGGGARARLFAEKPEFEPWAQPLPERAEAAWEIVLTPLVRAGGVFGTVIDREGRPVEGAAVSLGGAFTETDADGSFHVERSEELRAAFDSAGSAQEPRITAIKAGHLPARLPAPPELASPVVLQLGGPPLSIAGRVVDEEARPLAGVSVWVTGLTRIGVRSERLGESQAHFQVVAEDVLRGGAWESGAITAADGSFRAEGLLEKDYVLRAVHPTSRAVSPPYTLAAGSEDVELVLSVEPRTGRVAGRVVNPFGDGVEGLWLRVSRVLEGAA